MMQATIHVPGRPADGVCELEFKTPCPVSLEEGPEREAVRGILKDCWSQIFEEQVSVWFEDECSICGYCRGHQIACPEGAEK